MDNKCHTCVHCGFRILKTPVVVEPGVTLPPLISPIDRALDAISEAANDLLREKKFSKAHSLIGLAKKLQNLKPSNAVDDLDLEEDVGDNMPLMMPRRFNDGVDTNREVLMMAQGFLSKYMEIERTKAASKPTTRINEVMEMADLMRLRIQLLHETQPVPAEVETRISQLLQIIGAPNEPGSSTVVSAEPVRGHSTDLEGGPDGDRVGGPVADGAAGADDGVQEVRLPF